MSSSIVRRTLVAAALGAALVVAPAAQAKKFDVKPGKGTLQKAIDKAKPGDKLALKKKGEYRGGVLVDKSLTIRGPGNGKKLPTVDGRCNTAFTMLVIDSPVTLKNFKVTGATDELGSQYGGAEVNFIEGGGGAAIGLKMQDECGVKYGVNVFDTPGDVLVTQGRYKGYDDAGVYVGGIRNAGSSVEVTDNVATENNRGILIEDSEGNAGILVADNVANSNTNGFTPSGIFLHNADGVVISGNGSDSNPYAGIHIDVTSDGNRVLDNQASGNGAGAQGGAGFDFLNEGSGNCGSGNRFATVGGNPLGAC